jgi:hypothetical protein
MLYPVLLAAFICIPATEPAPMTFTTLDRGTHSQIEAPRTVVVRTAAEWSALWKEHAGNSKPAVVDFTRSMAIGVFAGSRPTAGFSVEVTQLETRGAALVVTYHERRPASDEVVAQMLTSPFHIVAVDSRARDVTIVQKR